MTIIVVFASSLFIALILVLIKATELKSGKRNVGLAVISKLDSKTIWLLKTLEFRGLQLVQSLRYLVTVRAKNAIHNLLDKLWQKAINEYRARHEVIMGRKDIVNKGSVSFYLKKIDESKKNGQKGEIN